MSFGGVGQGNVRYAIILDDADAITKLNEFKVGLNGIVQPSNTVTQNLTKLNTSFLGMGTSTTTLNTGVKTVTTSTGALGTSLTTLQTPTSTLQTNMGALSNNFKILDTAEKTAVIDTTAFKTGITAITAPTTTVNSNIGALSNNFKILDATEKTAITDTNAFKTGIAGIASPTQTLNTNMGALSNNFKSLDAVEKTAITDTNAFKNGISGITAPTQQVGNAVKTLGGSLSPLAGNFKRTSGAAGDMIAQTKNLSSESKSLGSRIKDNAGRFSTFAIGLGTVVSSSINLVRSFRDVQEGHIAVEKSARKLSTANEAVDKTYIKMQDAVRKYGANSKEAKQATLDHTQALQGQKIAVEVNAQKIKGYNDSLVDLGTSTIPTILGTMGTLTSAINDVGLKGGTMNKVVTKITSTFKELGSSALGLGGGIKGVATNLGLLAFAGIGAVGLLEQINKTMKIFQDVSAGTITPIEGLKKHLAEMQKLDFSTIEQAIITIAKLTGGSAALAGIIEKLGEADLNPLPNNIKKLGKSFSETHTEGYRWIDFLVRNENQLKKTGNWTEYNKNILKAKDVLGPSGLQSALDEVNNLLGVHVTTINKAIPPNQQLAVSIDKTKLGWIQLKPSMQGVTGETAKFGDKAFFAGKGLEGLTGVTLEYAKAAKPLPKIMADIIPPSGLIQGFGNDIDGLRAKFLALNTTTQGTSMFDKFVNGLQKTKEAMKNAFKITPDQELFRKYLNDPNPTAVLNKYTKEIAANKLVTDTHTKSIKDQHKVLLDQALALGATGTELKNLVGTETDSVGAVDLQNKGLTTLVNKYGALTPAQQKANDTWKEQNKVMLEVSAGVADIANTIGIKLNPNLIKSSQQLADATKAAQEFGTALADLKDPTELFDLKPFKLKFEIDKEFQKFFKDLPKGLRGNVKLAVQLEQKQKNVSELLGLIAKTELTLPIKFKKDDKSANQFVDDTIKSITDQFGKKNVPPEFQAAISKLLEIKKAPDSWSKLTAYFSSSEFLGLIGKISPQTANIIKALLPPPDAAMIKKQFQTPAFTNAIGDISATIAKSFGATGGKGNVITIPAPVIPAPITTAFDNGLKTAKTAATTAGTNIGTELAKVSNITIPAADQSKQFQKGLQLAIANSADTVKQIGNALKGVSSITIPAADQSKKFQKGLFLAIANAKKTVQLIEKALQGVKDITVPAPDLHDFNSALNQMVSNAKRAAREVKSALSSGSSGGGGRGPGESTGPFHAQGGLVLANKPTTATFGEAGPEAAVFLPLKSGSNFMASNSVSGNGVSDSRGGGDIVIEINQTLADERIMRKYRAAQGRDRYRFGA